MLSGTAERKDSEKPSKNTGSGHVRRSSTEMNPKSSMLQEVLRIRRGSASSKGNEIKVRASPPITRVKADLLQQSPVFKIDRQASLPVNIPEPARVPANMTLREQERHVQKLLNENWGLKLKINFLENQQKEYKSAKTLEAVNTQLQESNEMLRDTIEKQENQIKDLRKVEQACRNLETTNKALLRQISRRDHMIAERDQAMDEAGAMICSLENKLTQYESRSSVNGKPDGLVEEWLSSTLNVDDSPLSSTLKVTTDIVDDPGNDDLSLASSSGHSYPSEPSPPSIYNASSLFGPNGSIERLKHSSPPPFTNLRRSSRQCTIVLNSSPLSTANIKPTTRHHYATNTPSSPPPPRHHTNEIKPPHMSKPQPEPEPEPQPLPSSPALPPNTASLDPTIPSSLNNLNPPYHTLRRHSHRLNYNSSKPTMQPIPKPKARHADPPPLTASIITPSHPRLGFDLDKNTDPDKEPSFAGPIFDGGWQDPMGVGAVVEDRLGKEVPQRRPSWASKMGGVGRSTSRKLKNFGRKKA